MQSKSREFHELLQARKLAQASGPLQIDKWATFALNTFSSIRF